MDDCSDIREKTKKLVVLLMKNFLFPYIGPMVLIEISRFNNSKYCSQYPKNGTIQHTIQMQLPFCVAYFVFIRKEFLYFTFVEVKMNNIPIY